MQLQQIIALKTLVKALHQQLRAVTVDGQAPGTFLAAMEQAITICALSVQLGQQVVTVIEGGAQRLIQGRHALRLGGQRRRGSLPEQRGWFGAGASRFAPAMGR